MPTMSRAQAQALAAEAGRALAHYDSLVAKYGDDPGYDGAVIRFKKSYQQPDLAHELFGDGVRTIDTGITTINVVEYWYVAIRSGEHWFLSGRKAPQHLTWEQLLDFLGSGVPTEHIDRMIVNSEKRGTDAKPATRRPSTRTTRTPSDLKKTK